MTTDTANPTQNTDQQDFEDLEFTRGHRRAIVAKLIDKAIESGDLDSLSLLNKTMDGIDKAALGKQKLKQKNTENNTNQTLSGLMSQYLLQKATEPPPPPVDQMPQRDAPSLGNDVTVALPPGITNASPTPQNYEEFSQRMIPQT